MLKIKQTDRITNDEVIHEVIQGAKEVITFKNLKKIDATNG
jgi:hypothetical protein